MLRKLSAILFLFIVSTVIAQDVTFTKEPKASSERGGVKITFAVSAPTDVEVAVVNKQKEIVRHLAAGMLGSNAPEPLKKDALEQNLVWDFKDDFGKKVTPGTYTVRVGLGLAPEFDRTLGHDPNTLGKVRGLAFSPEGELFVLNMGHHLHVGFGSTICNVFDSKGVYKRTVMPYQASCFPDKVKEFGILDLGENGTYPWIHANHFKTIYPFSSAASHQHPVVTADGRFIIAMKVLGKGTMLVAVNSKDGSIPETGSFGPLLGSKDMRGSACLAAASDGKTLYVSGVASQKRYKPIIWKHAVFRAEWSDKEIKPFIGDPEKPGAGKEGLNEPQGVAVDKDGNIYVADRGNNRIAVFSPEGKFLSELPVKGPYMLAVHRTSGAVFVLGGGDPPDNIIKFNSYKDPKQAYTQKIPGLVGSKASLRGKKRLNDYPVFAMDTSGEELVVWIGSANAWDSFRLFRFTEKNGKLGKPEEKGKGSGFRACREIQVDRKREEVYFQLGGDSGEGGRCPRFVKINGMDGTVLKSLSVRGIGSHFALGHDGYVYVINSRKQIFRYDRDLKPVTFTGTDSKNSDPIPGHKYGRSG